MRELPTKKTFHARTKEEKLILSRLFKGLGYKLGLRDATPEGYAADNHYCYLTFVDYGEGPSINCYSTANAVDHPSAGIWTIDDMPEILRALMPIGEPESEIKWVRCPVSCESHEYLTVGKPYEIVGWYNKQDKLAHIYSDSGNEIVITVTKGKHSAHLKDAAWELFTEKPEDLSRINWVRCPVSCNPNGNLTAGKVYAFKGKYDSDCGGNITDDAGETRHIHLGRRNHRDGSAFLNGLKWEIFTEKPEDLSTTTPTPTQTQPVYSLTPPSGVPVCQHTPPEGYQWAYVGKGFRNRNVRTSYYYSNEQGMWRSVVGSPSGDSSVEYAIPVPKHMPRS